MSASTLSLSVCERVLALTSAHVLIPPVADDRFVCPRCKGARGQGFPYCAACAKIPYNAGVDDAGFLNYALDDGQLYRYLIDYKNPGRDGGNPDSSTYAFSILSFQLAVAAWRHIGCSNYPSPYPDLWANVPSSRQASQQSHAHPLHHMILGALPPTPPIRHLSASQAHLPGRAFDPRRFSVSDSHDIGGKHILIVDDLWVSGSSVDSLAQALKNRGAASVTALCIARRITTSFPPARPLVASIEQSRRTYSAAMCPWDSCRPCQPPAGRTVTGAEMLTPALQPTTTTR